MSGSVDTERMAVSVHIPITGSSIPGEAGFLGGHRCSAHEHVLYMMIVATVWPVVYCARRQVWVAEHFNSLHPTESNMLGFMLLSHCRALVIHPCPTSRKKLLLIQYKSFPLPQNHTHQTLTFLSPCSPSDLAFCDLGRSQRKKCNLLTCHLKSQGPTLNDQNCNSNPKSVF